MDYLEGRVDNLADVLYPSGLARLTLLPVGTRRKRSGDLLGHARMRGADRLAAQCRRKGHGDP